MKQYKKKFPVKAELFTLDRTQWSDWFKELIEQKRIFICEKEDWMDFDWKPCGYIVRNSICGNQRFLVGSYLIENEYDTLSCCSKEIFEKNYEEL